MTVNVQARPLSAAGLDNLTALARLHGYVRYFHPSDEAAGADWHSMLRAGVERVEDADGDRALLDALRALFAPVAPSVRIALQNEPSPQVSRPTSDLIAWRHQGLGGGSWFGRDTGYLSERGVPAAGTPMKTFILAALLALTAVSGAVVVTQSAGAGGPPGHTGHQHGGR